MNKTLKTDMKKSICMICFVALLLFSGCKQSSKVTEENYESAEQSGGSVDDNYISVIVGNYTDWDEAAVSGKVSMDKLPISPTAQIYMKKNEEIIISLRVPLLGEVGRIELDKKSIRAFNKLKNVYLEEETKLLTDRFNLSVGNLQDIILARLFIVGEGTLKEKHHKLIEKHVEASEPDAWYIIPKERLEEFNYGFKTDTAGIISMLLVAANNIDAQATFNYTPKEKGYQISAKFDIDNKTIEAALSYSSVDWKPNKIEKQTINNRWTKVGVKEFLKSF